MKTRTIKPTPKQWQDGGFTPVHARDSHVEQIDRDVHAQDKEKARSEPGDHPRLTLTLGRLDNLNGATFVQTGMMPW